MSLVLRWWVPEFWSEHVARHARPRAWPADLRLEHAPALVQDLAARGLWMEQEGVAVDPRVGAALAALLAEGDRGRGRSPDHTC